MGKNTRWPADALKKKGFVQNEKGDYVKVESLVAKGKVEKIVPEVGKLRAGIQSKAGAMNSNPMPNMTLDTRVLKLVTDNLNLSPEEMIRNFESTGYLIVHPSGDFTLPDGEEITVKHRFAIDPKPAPRMSRSDQWKTDPFHPDPSKRQRPVITRYWAWRDEFRRLCAEQGFSLDIKLRVVFIFPVPAYLSKARKAARMGQYHCQRPDYDNCCKSIGDAFRVDDGYIADVRAVKMWGPVGEILIF